MSSRLLSKLVPPALVLAALACNAGALGTSRPPTSRPPTAPPNASTSSAASSPVPNGAAPTATALGVAPATAAPGTPAAVPTTGPVVPVTSHPRLWLTSADLPRLRSWAVTNNPLFQNGLAVAAANAKADMDANRVPAQDNGATGDTPYPTEKYAELFAFMSLLSPDQATRDDYAKRAHTLLMAVMNTAVQGVAAGQPFRQPAFSTSHRSRWSGEAFALTVDWIYPYLTAADKATIRTVFLRWADEDLHAGITNDNHPEPIGTVNDPVLLSDRIAVRWAGNNYYSAHLRNLGLMALALDPADDPGNTLRNYLGNATGAWLYVADHLLRTDALGGLAPEGFEYGPQSVGFVAQFLLALHTAGQDDPAVWGPQVVLTNNPFWADVATGLLQSLSPATTTIASADYLGPVYQPAWFGAAQNDWMPDPIQTAGPLGIYDALTGNAAQLQALRWLVVNASPGGADRVAQRAASPLSDRYRDSILYFLLFDPAAAAPADPRPALPTTYFASGLGRLYARTGWDPGAAFFTFASGWASIDHQAADGNQFEFYRRGEWLTEQRVGYDMDYLASDNHNTLALQNDPPAHNDPGDYRQMLAARGSQWHYVSAGDGQILAHSFGPGYVYALGDATARYNSISEGATDIVQANRAIVWLQPDHIIVYDRATSKTANRFKRFWLNLPSLPTVSGNRATMATSSGQQLFVTSLLPSNAALTSQPLADEPSGRPAQGQTMQDRLLVEAPNGPANVRFLNILQGADAGAGADPATLIQSSAGTPFAGVTVHNTVILFPVDISPTLTSLTYSAPAGTLLHLVTGLAPNSGYDVVTQTVGSALQVVIRAGSTYRADAGGVLAFGQGVPVGQPGPLPTVTASGGATPAPTAPASPSATPAPSTAAAQSSGGRITYRLGNTVYRLGASAGAAPQNVSTALNTLAAGNDSWLNVSPDGAWLVMGTERFNPACVGWACLALVSGDLSAGSVISASGQVIHPDGFGAVASGGNLVVYPGSGGPHAQDLWAVTRGEGAWTAPELLTAGSPYTYNAQPALSASGDRVVFDCGDQPYADTGTAICEVGLRTADFRVVLTPADSPPGYATTGALHHPDYAPDGSIVFEGNWGVEQIWRLAAGGKTPALVTAQFANDNSPCVLPDGRIVSLWLDRPGNPGGNHELKVMAPSGANAAVLLPGQDVTDTGIGCGG